MVLHLQSCNETHEGHLVGSSVRQHLFNVMPVKPPVPCHHHCKHLHTAVTVMLRMAMPNHCSHPKRAVLPSACQWLRRHRCPQEVAS